MLQEPPAIRSVLLALLGSAGLLAAVACSSDPSATTVAHPKRAARLLAGPDQVTDMVIYDLSLTKDTATAHGVRRVFGARARQLTALTTRYATDSAGRYAALRTLNDETDGQLKTVIADPAEYRRFLTRRTEYYAGTPFTRGLGSGRGAPRSKEKPTSVAPAAPTTSARRAAPAVASRRRTAAVRTDRDGPRKIRLGLFKRRHPEKKKKKDQD